MRAAKMHGAVLRHDSIVELVRRPERSIARRRARERRDRRRRRRRHRDGTMVDPCCALAAGDARSAWANAPQRTRSDRHRSSVKVKRLFFFFADRHQHAWLERLDRDAIDLGVGKRMLVKGGKLNKPYQITVPEDLDAVR
jgi:hypothetical protein